MTETKTDHFEAGLATLSSDPKPDFPENAPWSVNGVAIPVNTVVNGGQNVDHYYPESVLEESAELLEGKPIVVDFHSLDGQADASKVIGEVTSAGYQKGVGLVWEGEIVDVDIAEKIKHGYLDVSPTPARSLGEFDESMGAQRVERLADFRDLAVVANGQAGNKIEMGSNPAVEALAMETLSRGFKPDTDPLESDMKTVAGVSFQGTKTGKLDESEIDKEETDLSDHALYGSGENKDDYSYWVVDADGFLRKGNVESAWSLGCRGQCPSKETHDENLMELANQFDTKPEFAQEETDTNADNGGDTEESESEPKDPEPERVVKEIPVKENLENDKVTIIE